MELGEEDKAGGKLAEVFVDEGAREEAAEVGLLEIMVLRAAPGVEEKMEVCTVTVGKDGVELLENMVDSAPRAVVWELLSGKVVCADPEVHGTVVDDSESTVVWEVTV